MHRTVRQFKSLVVEARFVPLIVSLCVLVMRVGLFVRGGLRGPFFPDTGFVWRYVAPWFANPWISFAAATVSVFVVAWLVAGINNRFSLIRTRTNLPFVMPLVLFSLHPYFLAMSPDLVAVVLITYAFFPLLNSYQQTDTQLFAFRTAVLVGIAALFQVYALFVLPLWWRGEWMMRGTHVKSFFASVFGVVLVFWSVFALYFFFDEVEGFLAPFRYFADVSVPDVPQFSVLQWTGIAITLGMFIFYMVLSMGMHWRDKVITLITIQFMVFLLIFLFALQVVYWRNSLFFLSLAIVLLSYLMAYSYTLTTKRLDIRGAYLIMTMLIAYYFANLFSFFG